MRALLFAAIALACASAARAQAGDVTGLGQYRLGMTREEVRSTGSASDFRELALVAIGGGRQTPTGNLSGPNLRLGHVTFSVRLEFFRDRLSLIQLSGLSAANRQGCEASFLETVAALEQRVGPLTGAQAPWEARGQTFAEARTPGGSVYRRYDLTGGRKRHMATTAAPYVVQVRGGHMPIGSQGACVTEIDVRNDFGLGPDISVAPPPPDAAMLAQAPLVEQPQLEGRVEAADLDALMPPFARDAEAEGSAILDCLVREDRSLACRVRESTPPDLGFGDTAIAMVTHFLAKPVDEGGPAPGSRFEKRFRFIVPE